MYLPQGRLGNIQRSRFLLQPRLKPLSLFLILTLYLPYNPPPQQSEKRQPFYTIFTDINNISHSQYKSIHISINSSLPSVNLHLGIIEDDDNCMKILLDTGASMNTCNLSCHILVMSQCTEMMGKFL